MVNNLKSNFLKTASISAFFKKCTIGQVTLSNKEVSNFIDSKDKYGNNLFLFILRGVNKDNIENKLEYLKTALVLKGDLNNLNIYKNSVVGLFFDDFTYETGELTDELLFSGKEKQFLAIIDSILPKVKNINFLNRDKIDLMGYVLRGINNINFTNDQVNIKTKNDFFLKLIKKLLINNCKISKKNLETILKIDSLDLWNIIENNYKIKNNFYYATLKLNPKKNISTHLNQKLIDNVLKKKERNNKINKI